MTELEEMWDAMAACGIAPEDDDGNSASRRPSAPAQPIPDITDHLSAIEACSDVDGLKTAYKEAYAACGGNQVLQAKVIAAKNAKKEQLNG